MAEIFAFREDKLGFRYQLGRKAVLGRAPECDLILFDRSASRQHAEIFMVEDKYFIADLGSTNGTLVNDQPILMQTCLAPYDTIKIGQELFVFEPGLSVIIGPAPSALIIENLHEKADGQVGAPLSRAAAEVSPEDVPALMLLSHRLLECSTPAEIESAILKYLRDRFGITFMALLWPTRPPARRLISLLTSHDDRRLILGETPFNRAIRNREVLLWPSGISELTFHDRGRHVVHVEQPALVGPLHADGETSGLMYLENQNRNFSERDLKAFAAMLVAVSPAVADMAGTRTREGLCQPDTTDTSDLIRASADTKIKIVFSTASQAAAETKSIMIHGEAGTGKSALAEYIHSVSPRKGGRLVAVNLANIPPAEIEAALFGVTHSSETEGRVGLVELADGGTLFLRHVEYLPPNAQKFLLMMLVEGLFFSLGARRAKAVDLRVISSTSIELAAKVEAGYFREDLYLRLNGVSISMPPLREIKADLENFLNHFLSKAARDLGINFQGVDPGAMECLRAYSWPGNITELKMESGLMVIFNRNGRVALEDLPAHLRLATDAFMGGDPEAPTRLIGESERRQLVAAMARCLGDLEQVAGLLGQRPEYIIQKMRHLGLDPINYQGPMPLHIPKGPGQTAVPAD
ncbi:MAG: sigma 54-interacting transcriptional regulator [Candidatus Adiutrix sp.]|jgi:DNA-binding NtrC family response regulator|nr:sigma 54-interacting transcriptional regulator [Candidatus Adiutrix sp.]